MKIARKFRWTSYAVFFFPQFSTLITLPPSRCTMPRMRSTILSTRSSARSGRTRRMVSYSRIRVPGAIWGGPPAVVVSFCCIGFHLLCTAIELVHGQDRPFQERGHGGLCRLRNQVFERLLLLRRELRQHPVRALPHRRRTSHPESHPDEIRRAQVL